MHKFTRKGFKRDQPIFILLRSDAYHFAEVHSFTNLLLSFIFFMFRMGSSVLIKLSQI